MGKKIIVFDFDKTLTKNDTIFGFYLYVTKKNLLFPCKIVLYVIIILLSKLKLINNTSLKKLGVLFFLSGLDIDFLKDKSKSYISQIKYNFLFEEFYFDDPNLNILIVSASYEIYLKHIFPKNVRVIGSKLSVAKGKVCGLNSNCYSENKLISLKNQGITNIHTFFTDNFSDKPLASIAERINLVKKNKIISFSNFDNFINYFE